MSQQAKRNGSPEPLKGLQVLNRRVRLEAFIVTQTCHEYFIVLVEEEEE